MLAFIMGSTKVEIVCLIGLYLVRMQGVVQKHVLQPLLEKLSATLPVNLILKHVFRFRICVTERRGGKT